MPEKLVKEHPIIFSGESIRAILDGRKTQTRRIIKPQPKTIGHRLLVWKKDEYFFLSNFPMWMAERCPYGKPGDRLWVRETWADEFDATGCPDDQGGTLYRATDPGWDDNGTGLKWKSPLFMPRDRSRLMLEITAIRAERLQDASLDGLWAEGMRCPADSLVQKEILTKQFRTAWDKLNGKTYPWASNPWVWVVEFKKVKLKGKFYGSELA